MKCDACKAREAQAEVRLVHNGSARVAHLCQECFTDIRSKYQSPVGAGMFSGFPDLNELFNQLANQQQSMTGQANPSGQTRQGGGHGGFLDEFGRNLTDAAKRDEIDPVIGRDKEVQRVIEVLNRRNKNNPVLIGEPGVGKTAIAEGLARKVVTGEVPAKLRGKQLYTLDVGSLVADTGIRGQFEERMKQLITELESRSDVILFIDEIHLLVGAGSAQGSMDAGNLLKPALARGQVQVIGATTLKEYRQIEKDAALERRFQPVMVNEPSVSEAIQILQGLRPKYESYHRVRFTDEALEACVRLSNRYIADRFLPDKAIDLMDEAGSKANLKLTDEDLTAELERVQKEKAQATHAEAYERAAELHKEEQKLRDRIAQGTQAASDATVAVEDIAQIVEDKTGIPVRKLQRDEQNQLRELDAFLLERVIGQPDAIKRVAKAVRRSRTGLRRGERPIGSFLFVGPTGVGKTELAKNLALALFGSKDAMVRLDMSEYMEKHAVSKLIGSPPGYVGYEEAGQLTEQVRRNPYSLILLDEIEKAHPDVQHMFLQIMEDGRLTDSQGRTVSFKDAIIIMTSNAGVVERKTSLGFHSANEQAAEPLHVSGLSAYFKPEFLNRFDAIVEFGALNADDLGQIVTLFLDEVKVLLAEQDINFSWTDEAKRRLGELGYDPQFGARPLRRVVQDLVEDQVADVLVDSNDCRALSLTVDDDGKLVVQKA